MITNPFRSEDRRRQFDAMVKDHASRSAALFHKDGRENQSNNIGNAFWRGFHGQDAHWVDARTPLHVAYVAGREIARAQRRSQAAAARSAAGKPAASQPVAGHDGRKWRTVPGAVKCKHCGATPIAARSVAGWTLACPNDTKHGFLFEQWMHKCKRKWALLHSTEAAATSSTDQKNQEP